METLLRQKVCKSKYKILITKHLEEENRVKKQENRYFHFRANGIGTIGFHITAVHFISCQSYRGNIMIYNEKGKPFQSLNSERVNTVIL